MSLVTSLVVTAVVWAVSMLRSLKLRALVYSLPLPITAVLLTTSFPTDGAQVAGVVLLVVFFVVVSLLHDRVRLPIIVADLGGVIAYVALAVIVASISPLRFVPTLAAVLAMWAVANLLIWRWERGHRVDESQRAERAPPDDLGALRKLLVIFLGSLVAVSLGGLLSGLVVTFPYSGVLVAVESRRSLPAFTRLFARNSLALVAFMAGYYALAEHGKGVALLVAWLAFGATAAALHWRDVLRCSSRFGTEVLQGRLTKAIRTFVWEKLRRHR